VLALNHMDEALRKGLYINVKVLEQLLGLPVVPTVALMGQGLPELFERAAASRARAPVCPLPQPPSAHIAKSLEPLSAALNRPTCMPPSACRIRVAAAPVRRRRRFHRGGARRAFSRQLLPELRALREAARGLLPRPLAEELHADRHHRAATLAEAALRMGRAGRPRLALLARRAVPASALGPDRQPRRIRRGAVRGLRDQRLDRLDDHGATGRGRRRLAPESTGGVVGRAVVDGLIGLTGIVVPYMIPLVMLLVSLEQVGLMQRIAFVVDRGFHRIGLHGGVALPFLLGLGCNVPAISARRGLPPGASA
jgi:ferrous iron transport protein B